MNPKDRKILIDELDECEFPLDDMDLDTAWLGFYQMLMYYSDTSVDDAEIAWALHVDEVSALRSESGNEKAKRAETYIAKSLGLAPSSLFRHVDRMMRLPRWKGKQRHNPLGNGFRSIFAEVLTRFGNPKFEYLEEEKATEWFPGIQLFGRSRTPSIDILVVRNRNPRAVVSCKWSIRHDRISDPTNECIAYSQAAQTWQGIKDFEYFVFTNEFSAARLEKVLDQPCVAGLVHAHVPLLKQISSPDHDLWKKASDMSDLTEFVRRTWSW